MVGNEARRHAQECRQLSREVFNILLKMCEEFEQIGLTDQAKVIAELRYTVTDALRRFAYAFDRLHDATEPIGVIFTAKNIEKGE